MWQRLIFTYAYGLVDGDRWDETYSSSCLMKFRGGTLRTSCMYFEFEMDRSANKGVCCACEFSLCTSNLKSYKRGNLKGINTLFGKAKISSGSISYWNKLWYSPLSSGWHVITCLDSSRLFNLWHICLWLYALQVIFVGRLDDKGIELLVLMMKVYFLNMHHRIITPFPIHWKVFWYPLHG